MKKFSNNQKIRVVAPEEEDGEPRRDMLRGRTGVVTRLRMKDNGAWVRMDQPLPDDLRVFSANDASGRGDHILLYPDECEPTGT